MKSKDWSWSIFNWLIILEMFMSLDVWFFWGVNRIIASAIVTLYCLFFFVSSPHFFRIKNNSLITGFIFVVLASCVGNSTKSINLNGWIGIIIQFMPAFFVVLLKEERARQLFEFFKKVLSVVLFFSVSGWVIHLAGFPLPHASISYGDFDGSARYVYENYYIFLDNIKDRMTYLIPRFSSIFTEPGYLGCILTVVLFSEEYAFKSKNRNYIFLISLVLSFSLAGWLISILGFTFTKIKFSVKNYFTLFLVLLSFFILSVVARKYNNGDNMLNQTFFERIEYDNTIGRMQGYNRSRIEVDDYFYNYFIHGPELWFGEGVESANVNLTGSVDWKSYLIRYGLISGLLVLIYYLWPFISSKRNKYHLFGVALVFLLIAIQTTYGIFSCMYISLFALSIKTIRMEERHGKQLIRKKDYTH